MPVTRFDHIVWGLLALLLLAIVAVMAIGDRVGVSVSLLGIDADLQLGASAPLVLVFDQRMRAASVEERLVLEPEVPGEWSWVKDRLYFLPAQPWQPGDAYSLSLAAGAQSQLGHATQDDLAWSFQVRSPGVVYLLESASQRQLWVLTDLQSDPVRLSLEEHNIFDFGVSPDGELVLYAVANEENGLDFWSVNPRSGGAAELFLNCRADRCSAPAWSPDGSRVAYSRAPAGLGPAEPYGPTRIWLLDLASGETLRLHADSQKLGYSPSWSPDGSRLAYFDGVEGRIVVVAMDSGEETYLSTQSGLTGTWSPDSRHMLYFDIESRATQSVNVIYRADFETQDVLPLFDPTPQDAHYSNPTWSPADDWVAFRVRPLDAPAAGDQVWVTPPDGSYAIVVDGAEAFLHTDLAWDPWGEQLLFKRIQLGVSFPDQELWLWSQADNRLRQVLPNAVLPTWLP